MGAASRSAAVAVPACCAGVCEGRGGGCWRHCTCPPPVRRVGLQQLGGGQTTSAGVQHQVVGGQEAQGAGQREGERSPRAGGATDRQPLG